MPESAITTTNRGYTLVRKALHQGDVWDWFGEYLALWTQVDADIQDVADLINTALTDVYRISVHTSADVRLNTLGAASVQSLLNHTVGSGNISGGEVTPNSTNPLTQADVAAGQACIATGSNEGDPQVVLSYSGKTVNAALNENTYVYIFCDGSIAEIKTTLNPLDFANKANAYVLNVLFGRGDRPLGIANFASGWGSALKKATEKANDIAIGKGTVFFEYAYGLILSTSGLNISLTEGVTYGAAYRKKEYAAFDSSGADTFTYWRETAENTWEHAAQSELNNTQYNLNYVMTTMGNNYYKVNHVYRSWDGSAVHVIEASEQFVSIEDAETGPLPPRLPPEVPQFSIHVGWCIVQRGSTTVIPKSAFAGAGGGGTTSHAALTGYNLLPAYQHLSIEEKTKLLILVGLISDVTFYVAPTGNDTTGNGSLSTPYATVEKCFTLLPPTLPAGTLVTIKMANGTYTSFPGCINNKISTGQILIDGYEHPVDVLAGPYTVSDVSRENFTGTTFTVSGASFPDDGLRDSDNNPVWIKLLTGTYAGNIYPVFENGTDTITVLDKETGIANGDTFKIVSPGVRVVTDKEIVLSPISSSGTAALGLYNISIISSFSPDATHDAAVKISEGHVCLQGVNIQADAAKSYALTFNSTSVNSAELYDPTKLSYYTAVTGQRFDPPYWGFCFHANGMTGTSFKSGKSVALTSGGKAASGQFTGTSVYGLCTRTEMTVQAADTNVSFCAISEIHVQQSTGRTDLRALIMRPRPGYGVLVSDGATAVVAHLNMKHQTPGGQLLKVESGSTLNDLTGIESEVSEDHIVSVDTNCQMNLLAVPSINGAVSDIYFVRSQGSAPWPAVGRSVGDGENSFVSVEGSLTTILNRDALGFLEYRAIGAFTIPIGTSAGYYDIIAQDLMKETGTSDRESLRYECAVGLRQHMVAEYIISDHKGLIAHTGLWGPSENVDTVVAREFLDMITNIEVVSSADAADLTVRVTWDTTERYEAVNISFDISITGSINSVMRFG